MTTRTTATEPGTIEELLTECAECGEYECSPGEDTCPPCNPGSPSYDPLGDCTGCGSALDHRESELPPQQSHSAWLCSDCHRDRRVAAWRAGR